jgi:hypothetical protein
MNLGLVKTCQGDVCKRPFWLFNFVGISLIVKYNFALLLTYQGRFEATRFQTPCAKWHWIIHNVQILARKWESGMVKTCTTTCMEVSLQVLGSHIVDRLKRTAFFLVTHCMRAWGLFNLHPLFYPIAFLVYRSIAIGVHFIPQLHILLCKTQYCSQKYTCIAIKINIFFIFYYDKYLRYMVSMKVYMAAILPCSFGKKLTKFNV